MKNDFLLVRAVDIKFLSKDNILKLKSNNTNLTKATTGKIFFEELSKNFLIQILMLIT